MRNWFIWMVVAHATWLLSLEVIVLAGSEECLTEENQPNIKIFDSSAYYYTYTIFISGNMLYNMNLLKVHHYKKHIGIGNLDKLGEYGSQIVQRH